MSSVKEEEEEEEARSTGRMADFGLINLNEMQITFSVS